MPTDAEPAFRLRDRERILPEASFRRNLGVTRDRHPPGGGWEGAKGAFLTRFRRSRQPF